MFSAVPLLVACPKDKPAAVDAAPPPPPPPVEDVVTNLEPLPLDDGGADADADADAGKKPTGSGVSTNVLRLKQCCGQLRTQAKAMGASPEAGMLMSAATQCDTMAAQIGPGGSAPELNVLRGLLAGRTIPAACSGF